MTWLLWQQYRRLATAITIAFVVAGIFLAFTGLHLASTYHSALQSCRTATGGCANLNSSVFIGDNRLIDIVDAVGFLLPFVLGLFWGAPIVAKEIEEGTHRLAWTQSVSRLRWLISKLGWVLLAAVVLAGAMSAIVLWWYGPINAVQQNRLGSVVFDTQGLVPIGYALFGVAFGAMAGALLRRALPAMATTLAAVGLIRYVIDEYVRPHLLPPKTLLVNVMSIFGNYPAGTGSWVLGSPKVMNAAGKALSGPKLDVRQLPAACRPDLDVQLVRCLTDHGFHALVSYQPAGRFWPLQEIELGIYAVLAATCIAVTCFLVVRRDS